MQARQMTKPSNKSMNMYKAIPLLISLLLISFCGCGKDYGVELHYVSGTVTLDGEPLPEASVEFRPVPGSDHRGTIGYTNASGFYKQLYRDGVGSPAGEYRVTISTYAEPADQDAPDARATAERVHPSYQGKLKAVVTPGGDNTFNFDLSSKGYSE